MNIPGQAGWRLEKTQLPMTADGMEAFVYGDYVYMVGGEINFSTVVGSVYKASLIGGTIGNWVPAGNLPVPMYAQGQLLAQNDSFVYFVGGFDATFSDSSIVQVGRISSDGSISWRLDPQKLPVPMGDQACIIANNVLYVIGNRFGSLPLIMWTHLNSDGSLVGWNTKPLNTPGNLGSLGFIVTDGENLYYGGGFDASSNPVYNIWKSQIIQGGAPGPWTKLPFGLANSHQLGTMSVVNNIVCLVCGSDQGEYNIENTNIVETFILSNKSITAPTKQSPFPFIVANPGSFTYNGRIYVLGGLDPSGNDHTTIYSAAVQPNGAI